MQAKAKYAVSGALAGTVNGLFGGGGGMVLVPLLSGWCGMEGKRSFATCVAVILPLSAVSAAVYLLRQVRRQPDAKKYAVSRGMLLPVITEREVLGNPEIRVPAGASVLERAEYNEETVVQYVRYVPKKRESRTEDGGGEHGI